MSNFKTYLLLAVSLFGMSSNVDAREVTLEEQVRVLAELGLTLNEGVVIEDLLYNWQRKDFEEEPFNIIFFAYGSDIGREPWGRNVCDKVWNFDVEFIDGDGSYVEIVKRFSQVAGATERISDVIDSVNFETGKAWVSYKLDGKQKRYEAILDDDWADPDIVASIMGDMEKPGYDYYFIDNGQASVWFYLTKSAAKELNKLSNRLLKKV